MIHPYLWMVVVGGFVCFLVACGNGSNDLSNSFGTSYGSRVLTMMQIILIASCCEFGGAAGLGSHVATTVSSTIARPSTFQDDPYVLMYGFLCTLGATFMWLFYSTTHDLTIASGHAVAGGIIGFSLVYGGVDAVIWAAPQSTFPYVAGVAPIFISWVISPLLAAGLAALMYSLARYLFLERAYAVRYAPFIMPIVVFVIFFLEFIFIFMNAAANKLHWTNGHAAWMAAVVGAGISVASLSLIPFMKRRLEQMRLSGERHAAEEGCDAVEAMRQAMSGARTYHAVTFATREQAAEYRREMKRRAAQQKEVETLMRRATKAAAGSANKKVTMGTRAAMSTASVTGGSYTDVSTIGNHLDAVTPLPTREEMWAPVRTDTSEPEDTMTGTFGGSFAETHIQGGTEKVTEIDPNVNYLRYDEHGVRLFDPRAEYMFRMLQVVTAACTSLAHGSNEVSTAIAPYIGMYQIYRLGTVETTVKVETWTLCLGGAGVVTGLSLFGLPIMRMLGEKLAVLTPVRGCAGELSTALIVSLASVYGIPLSSTQCIATAVVIISWMDVGFWGVNWALTIKMCVGWVMTLVMGAIIAAVFFAQGINAPSPRNSS